MKMKIRVFCYFLIILSLILSEVGAMGVSAQSEAETPKATEAQVYPYRTGDLGTYIEDNVTPLIYSAEDYCKYADGADDMWLVP